MPTTKHHILEDGPESASTDAAPSPVDATELASEQAQASAPDALEQNLDRKTQKEAAPRRRKGGKGDASKTQLRPSKKLTIQKLLQRKSGTSMDALMDATGWQAHSVRAAISGLRQTDLRIERKKNRKGETLYAATIATDS
ncbi:MAG: DUF3489 domain-containing protein [Hyphomicrobiales bacterium]